MKALLTGATSFSGLWLSRALHARGFEVVAPVRRAAANYTDVRAERVAALAQVAEIVEDVEFGSAAFVKLVETTGCDVLCHHAAEVTNYRSPEFDVAAALAANTRGFPAIAELMKARAFKAVIGTGSAFEPDGGAGEVPLRAFSPYGLSKAFTNATLRYWCDLAGLPFGKFVIANPVGPYEEPRFCAYLMKTWAGGQTPAVRTPDYVRDNIHVDALARTYAAFVAEVAQNGRSAQLAPSMYVESQGAFAERFAREVGKRVAKPCVVKLCVQTDFTEPMVRINTDHVNYAALGFDETSAWDEIVAYYSSRLNLR